MKRTLKLTIIYFFLCFSITIFSACGNAVTDALANDKSNNNGEVLHMNTDNNKQALKLYSVIASQKSGGPVQPNPVIIRTVDDMQNYYQSNESAYLFDTDKTWHTEKNFKELITQFDNSYFARYSLIIFPIKETAQPVNYRVIAYSVNKNKLNLQIEKQTPLIQSMSITCYHLAIEIPKSTLFSEVETVFTNR